MVKQAQYFIIDTDGPVIIWKYNNPPKNLLTVESGTELGDLVEDFYTDPNFRVGIITSNLPDVFIQHFDVSVLVNVAEALRAGAPKTPRAVPRGLYRCGPKPIIAAINAQLAGGGSELSLACDFRFMSRAATIGQPEVLVGILPGGGGTQRLTRRIGVSKALELMLTGRRIYADEAERIGYVHRACDPDELMPAAIAFAKELAKRPPLALALIKRCIYEGIDMTLQDGLALEWDLFLDTLKSDDALNLMKQYVATGQDVSLLPSL
jgi:enoyl-CoA hydratase/carnithine racemase